MNVAAKNTREQIMDAAEELFSAYGFRSVSMREIAKAANTHVGSISYHFTTKESLLLEIYQRHCHPINARRAELMREAQRITDAHQRLEAVIRAYVVPAFSSGTDIAGGGARFTRLRAVMSAEGNEAVRNVIASTFDDMSNELIAAVGHCLPELPRNVIVWRCHFLLGALYFTLVNPDRITRLSQGASDGKDFEEAIKQLVDSGVASLKGNF